MRHPGTRAEDCPGVPGPVGFWDSERRIVRAFLGQLAFRPSPFGTPGRGSSRRYWAGWLLGLILLGFRMKDRTSVPEPTG